VIVANSVLKKKHRVIDKSQGDAVFNEGWMRKGFREYICSHVARRAVGECNDLVYDMFPEKMILYIDMPRTCMKFGIPR